MANIGYIGLGAMGSQMVDRLLQKGHAVTGYNRTRSKAEWLIEKRMQWADSPREVGEAADVILSMVSNDAALLDVAEGPQGLLASLKPDQLWVDMSTVSAATARSLVAKVREKMLVTGDPKNPGMKTMEIGKDRWPFPIPIVQAGNRWHFDVDRGKREILMRRIGANELAVIDIASHQVIKRLPQASPFSPNIAVSPENDEVWITLKDTGKVQTYSAKPPFEQKALLDTGPITNHVNFVNNRNGKFAYVSIGGLGAVQVFRRGSTPELMATIPVGDLPHGIWPSGDGSRVYVALENGEHCVAVDTLTNKVTAEIPIGQTTQALVYVPNAVPSGSSTENLTPLGVAANTARLHLEADGATSPKADASVAVNSLGLLDLIQIAAKGLAPQAQYQVYLAESNQSPFGKREPLAVLKTNPDGAGIVQAIGPLKVLGGSDSNSSASQRFLIVTDLKDSSQVVLRQTKASSSPEQESQSP